MASFDDIRKAAEQLRLRREMADAPVAGFLVLADVPGRMLSNPAETPIGVVTAFIGAPFFIYLLRTRRIGA